MQSEYPFMAQILQDISQLPDGTRYLIGIAGPPATGKSFQAVQLARKLNEELGQEMATVFNMDAYHYRNEELFAKGMYHHKGAHFTFDVQGFMEKMIEIRESEGVIKCPIYDRAKHDPTPDTRIILPHHRIVIVEGNYLLCTVFPWIGIRYLLDFCLFVEVDPDIQFQRLMARHLKTLKDQTEAEAKVRRTDLPNSELILESRGRADYIFRPAPNFKSNY